MFSRVHYDAFHVCSTPIMQRHCSNLQQWAQVPTFQADPYLIYILVILSSFFCESSCLSDRYNSGSNQGQKARRYSMRWISEFPTDFSSTWHGFNSTSCREALHYLHLWESKAFYQCSAQSCIGLQHVDIISPTYYQEYRRVNNPLITIITMSIQQLFKMTIDSFFWAMEIRKVRLCTPWTEPQARTLALDRFLHVRKWIHKWLFVWLIVIV